MPPLGCEARTTASGGGRTRHSLPRSAAPSGEQKVIRRQRAREVAEQNLICSRRNDGVGVMLADDEVNKRLHAGHAAKLDLVLLALAEVFDRILRPDGR